MNAFLDRVHNFILPIVRGEDRVCSCTCGGQQVRHVVPYHQAQTLEGSADHHCVSDIMTKQEMDMITGLFLGLCISLFLLWLDVVRHSGLRCWRANRLSDLGLWTWTLIFSNTRDLFSRLLPRHTEDQTMEMPRIKQDMSNNMNGSV